MLLRVGSNVRLLKKLGFARERASTVYLWPDREAQRREPPLVLRLAVAHTGRHPVFLVTSVLSTRDLTDQQVVELYARRWGIELFYRHLKQTFQRRKLRSARAECALRVGVVAGRTRAMALYCAVADRAGDLPPPRLSIAGTLRAFRRRCAITGSAQRGRGLCDALRKAVIDDYPRGPKASRDYPRKNKNAHPERRILNASPANSDGQNYFSTNRPKGLTA